MKKLLLTLPFFLIALTGFAQTVNPHSHTVHAYQKKNGTMVEQHKQTNPNGTLKDNYSSKGNTNPATGKTGTATPTNTNGKDIKTGPKGGQYYINNNGNKTYIKQPK